MSQYEFALPEIIMETVRELKVIKAATLSRYLSPPFGHDAVKRALNKLKTIDKILFDVGKTGAYTDGQDWTTTNVVSYAKTPPKPLAAYKEILIAAEMLAEVGYHNVKWFGLAQYPAVLVILTVTDRIFDFTVFDDASKINILAPIILPQRQRGIPEGTEDATYHCAIIRDKAMIPILEAFAYDRYILIDSHDKVIETIDP